jgi:hypothetical protein
MIASVGIMAAAQQGAVPMALTLDPGLAQEIEERARAQGYHNPNEYLRILLHLDPPPGAQTPGEQLVRRLRGTSKIAMTTEQTMNLTRSEK